MTHYGTLRDYHFSDTIDDIRGSALYGLNDEKLGKIKDVIFDHDTGAIRYVVVDTGGWLKTKQFIVPAHYLKPAAAHENDYYADLTKTQVETFPPYDENAVESQDKWTNYENQYQTKWVASTGQPGGTEWYAPSDVSGQNLGTRWSSFENRLRHDRDRIVSTCTTCGRPAASERFDRERKIS